MNRSASVLEPPLTAPRARGDVRRATQAREARLPTPPLSAPELCVLRDGGRGDGREALRMAVVELIVRGVLRLESQGSFRRSASVQLTGVEADLAAPVAAVAASLCGARMNLRDLEHELSLAWLTPRDYVWSEVLPALCAKGLVEFADRRRGLSWLGAKPMLTPPGRQAQRELDARLAAFDGPFGRWVRDDAGRAAAFVAQAGSVVLLAGTAWREVRELYVRRIPEAGSGATGAWETGVYTSMRLMALDPGFDLSILGDGLDGWAHGDAGGSGGGGDAGGCGGDGGC